MGGATAGIGALGALAALLTVYLAARRLPSDTASASVEQAAKLLAERESLTDDLREDYGRMRAELEEERKQRHSMEKIVATQTEKIMELGRRIRRLAGQVRELGGTPDDGIPDDA